jgi:hypothetical protein
MITTSSSLIVLIDADFSYLSIHCPAVAENKKKGSIKRAAAILINKSASI